MNDLRTVTYRDVPCLHFLQGKDSDLFLETVWDEALHGFSQDLHPTAGPYRLHTKVKS
jgi:hypothetical protein